MCTLKIRLHDYQFGITVIRMFSTDVSNQKKILQVINRGASLIHMWSYLLPPEQRGTIDIGCNHLMAVIWAIFNQGA
jgi:hypothetical protein